jgi:hypothetical protein
VDTARRALRAPRCAGQGRVSRRSAGTELCLVRGYTDRIDGAELKIAGAVRPSLDKSAVEHVFFIYVFIMRKRAGYRICQTHHRNPITGSNP